MVQAGFTRKKVESLTLGEKLKKLRNDFRMSLPEISKATRIQVKYLEYLENGEYDKLPADVYVRGFLRSYARYLNIDELAFIKLYERERNIQANLGRDAKSKFEVKSLTPASIVISPRAVVMGIIVLLVSGAFFYLYQEFKSFASVPRLVISEPQNGAVLTQSEVTVKGKTDKGSQVTINNQSVFVESDGDFSDTLILQPGTNSVTITTINRFDKEKSETLSLEANYAITTSEPPATMPEVFRVQVTAKEIPVTLTVLADNGEVFKGVLAINEVKTFEAKENITITSNKGSATLVRFNDGEEKPLGEAAGQVKDVVFVPTGRQE